MNKKLSQKFSDYINYQLQLPAISLILVISNILNFKFEIKLLELKIEIQVLKTIIYYFVYYNIFIIKYFL